MGIKKRFTKTIGLLLLVGLFFAALPAGQAQAQTGETLQVNPFTLQTGGSGDAVWKGEAYQTGSLSVLLATDHSGCAGVGTAGYTGTINDITDLSFWYQHNPYASWVGPRMSLFLAKDGLYYRATTNAVVRSDTAWKQADAINGQDDDFYVEETNKDQIWGYSQTGEDFITEIGDGVDSLTFTDLKSVLDGANVVSVVVYVDAGSTEGPGGAYIDNISVNGITYYGSIQDAVDAASAGDTIEVADGTYDYTSEGEPLPDGLIKVKKPLTIKAAEDGNEIRPVIDGSGFNGVFKIWHSQFSGGEVVIEGFDIYGDATTDIAITAAMCDGDDPTKIIIRDNVIHGMIGGIDFWGSGSFCADGEKRVRRVEITDNEFYDLGEAGTEFGFGVYLEGLANWTAAEDQFAASVENNLFHDIINGPGATDYGVGIAITSPDATNSEAVNASIVDNTFEQTVQIGVAIQSGDVSEVNIVHNQFNNAWMYVVDANISNLPVAASPNWWGSITGPADGQVIGDVNYSPWCSDEDCSFLVFLADTSSPEGFQNSISYISVGGALYVPSNPPSQSGGYNVGGITLILGEGVNIENDSPCFVITASHTTITAESYGSATCVATDGNSGFVVNSGLEDVTIDGLDITGDNSSNQHGIEFLGAITDLQIVNNNIHNLTGDGIYFAEQPAGTVQIQGNLFMENGGNGIEAGDFIIPAEYNAWGHIDGAALGDGVSANVDADPWTHVDLYLESSGTLIPDQVECFERITYTVYANFKNVMGTEFTLKYPSATITYVASETVLSGTFDAETFTPDTSAGTLTFQASNSASPAESGEEVVLFSVTFEANDTPGTYLLDLDELTDVFTMAPSSGSSVNIYATDLVDSSVEVTGEHQYIFPIFFH